jgi:hypothetical protein
VSTGRFIGYVVAIPTALIIFFVVLGGLIVLDGFIIRDIFNWHVSNILNLRHIGIKEAMGLSIAWNAFAYKAKGKSSEKGELSLIIKNHIFGVISLWILAWAVFQWPWWS